MQVTRH